MVQCTLLDCSYIESKNALHGDCAIKFKSKPGSEWFTGDMPN